MHSSIAWSSSTNTRNEESARSDSRVGSTDQVTACMLRSFTVKRWVVIKDIEYMDIMKTLREEMIRKNQRHCTRQEANTSHSRFL